MKIIKTLLHASLATLLCVPVVSSADGLRCGNRLVLKGQSRVEVRAKCGEPSDVVHSTMARRAAYADRRFAHYAAEEVAVVPIETWTYNFGAHRFMYRLEFSNGILTAIRSLDYGFE